MKCPRCGNEMVYDFHRKYPIMMCYSCGYAEGRKMEQTDNKNVTNFEHMRSLNFNELTAFLSSGLGLPEEKLASWLDDLAE